MAGTTEETGTGADNGVPRRWDAARLKQKHDQSKDKYRRASERRAMNRAALVLALLAMTGDRRAVRIAETDFETRRIRAGCQLRRHRAREHGMEHEGIGGDPAEQLAREAHSWSRRYHPCPKCHPPRV